MAIGSTAKPFGARKAILTLVFHPLVCHPHPALYVAWMRQGGQGMKRRILCVLAPVVLALCGLMPMVHAASIYTDPRGRFSLTVPDGFIQESDSEPQFTSESPVIALFDVVVQPNTDGLTLDQTAAQLAAQLPDVLSQLSDVFDNVQVVPNSAQITTLGGQPARSLSLIATADDLRLRFTVIYTIAGGNLYGFIYGGLDEDYPTIQREIAPVIVSFKFGTTTATSGTPTATISATRTPTPATPAPATVTSVPSPQAMPVQPVATGPTGLPEPPFTPRRLGNG